MNLPINLPFVTKGTKASARMPSPVTVVFKDEDSSESKMSLTKIGVGSIASTFHGECPSTAVRYDSEKSAPPDKAHNGAGIEEQD